LIQLCLNLITDADVHAGLLPFESLKPNPLL
jgi:hypothetical protein